jgi:hypothetical protein
MFPPRLPNFQPYNSFKFSLVERVFLISASILLAMTLVDAYVIQHPQLNQDELLLAKLKAQKVVVAQDSLFTVDVNQYKP